MFNFLFISIYLVLAKAEDHLLLTKIVTQPNEAELISIYNPTESNINLSNYYISDASDYYKIQTENNNSPSSNISGFTARFPSIDIEPFDTLKIALNENYNNFWGENFLADLVLFGNSDSSLTGSIGFGNNKINENSELIILFKWDGNSANEIEDIDYFIWSSLEGISDAVDKTNITEYLNDTSIDNQLYFEEEAKKYYSYTRFDLNEIDEIQSGGNGITNNNETSENLRESWVIKPLFNLGCTSIDAINYEQDAEVDDESCYYTTITDILTNSMIGEQVTTAGTISDYFDVTPFGGPHSISIAEESSGSILEMTVWPDSWTDELKELTQPPYLTKKIKVIGLVDEYEGNIQLSPISISVINSNYNFQVPIKSISDIKDGNLDNKLVACNGLLVDYFDITVYNGPHSLTIEDEEGYRIELSIWPNTYDIINSSQSYLLNPPFNQYYISVIGSVGEYKNEKQLTISGANHINIVDTLNFEGEFIPDDSSRVKIIPAPYVLIPTIGETLDFSYSFLDNSRVIIRILDLSGRFITSLVDKYYTNAGTVNRFENSSAWNGRNQIGQIVPPGTYIMHLETINPITGDTHTDSAPVVIGVKN